MGSIITIPTTRVSDIFIRQRMLNQVQADQAALFKTETQLSTGRRFEAPSEDPVAAMRVVDLQRLLERKSQVYANVTTNQSYLSATDTALSDVSAMLAEVRGLALGVLGTTSTDVQRATVAQQVDQTLQQLLDTGNQQFRGRYLFAGSETTIRPFGETGKGAIEYTGNEKGLSSYADIDLLFQTNVTGSEVFGAISTPVEGMVDLNPNLTYDTRLSDLNGGQGIHPESIAISDGTNTSIVDLSGAETIGDLCAMIKANPPENRTLYLEITPDAITIQIDEGDLSIREVAGGTTADELGILRETGVGTHVVKGRDLDPMLRKTTSLENILGARARAVLHSSTADSDLIFEADDRGTAWNGVTVELVDTAPAHGAETVTWTEASRTLTVGIKLGETTAADVVDAVRAAHDVGTIDFTAHLDPLDQRDQGQGLVEVTSSETQHGIDSGIELDWTSGIQILNGNETHVISLTAAETMEDVLNTFNGAGAGLLAEFNDDATGINVRSRLSGADFAIGENGGSTAKVFGLRTFTEATKLEDLHFGRGINYQEGDDFVITRKDGTELAINIDDSVEDMADLLALINTNGNNADGKLTARLSRYGNGIELVDTSVGADELTVTRTKLSTAAIELGLVPEGQESSIPPTPGGIPSAVLGSSAVPNCQLRFQATTTGTEYNEVTIEYVDTGIPTPGETVSWNAGSRTLTFDIDSAATNANRIKEVFDASPYTSMFSCSLYGAGNDGTGLPGTTAAETSGGEESLTSTELNPQETVGVFNALVRLRDALNANDIWDAQRAVDQLDATTLDLNFRRAELGARQQGLDLMQSRLDTEEIELREVLSLEYDADLVEVISNLTAQQIAYQAALRATAQISQMSLLDYL